VSGLGYRIHATPPTAAAFHVGQDCFVYVHHHIREEAQTLYGFCTRDERSCFEALLGAHGVGPSLAIAILSVFSPAQLHATLAHDDLDALTKVPGVGKKTATRLLVDLKSRLDLPLVDLANISEPRSELPSAQGAHADVRDALSGLGYTPEQIRKALADLPTDGDASLLVRQALRTLAKATS
jgi:Holliday junction DNA helicase RuvA